MVKLKPVKRSFLKAFFIGVALWLLLHSAMLYPHYDIFTILLIFTTFLGVCSALLFFYTDKIAWILFWVFLGVWLIFHLLIGIFSIFFGGLVQAIYTFAITLAVIGIKRRIGEGFAKRR